MTVNDIKQIKVSGIRANGLKHLMDNEIDGVAVNFIRLKQGESHIFREVRQAVSILIMCSGKAVFSGSSLNEPGVYINRGPVEAVSSENCEILQLIRSVSAEELVQFEKVGGKKFPFIVTFASAPAYLEDCKSEKTTSRMIVPEGLVPRFAMGSVETSGDDIVSKHRHPMLEQFFFGLSGNDCNILIEDFKVPFSENHLVHIPLGSDHGVESEGNQIIRYIWLDFLIDEEAVDYMKSTHRMIEEGK